MPVAIKNATGSSNGGGRRLDSYDKAWSKRYTKAAEYVWQHQEVAGYAIAGVGILWTTSRR